jgi:glycosyltransferase involved in cell wall biosynthesis
VIDRWFRKRVTNRSAGEPRVAAAEAVARPARRRLRIVSISYFLPRPGCRRGGIERVAHDLAQGLAARGHTVRVFSFDPPPPDASYDVRLLPWRRFVSTWLGKRLTMGYLGNVLSVLPDFGDCEVVIAHGDSLLLPLRGRPLVRVMHGTAIDEARTATRLGRRVLQSGVFVQEVLSAALQPGTVGVSEHTRARNRFVRHVIPNGVNLSTFRPEPSVRCGRPMLASVGALDGRKRGGWLVAQFEERIRPRWPDAELHLVCAPGPARPGVIYHTGLTDTALADLYRRAWVYVSASTYEGFGLPYVEALACGTPVVATPNPGSLEVLDGGRYGWLPPDEAFAETIAELLGDPVRREEMARRGLARAEALSLDRMLDRYEDLLLGMVRDRER